METWGSLPRLQNPFPNLYFKPQIFSICLNCFKIYFHLFSHQSSNFRRINKISFLFESWNFIFYPHYQQFCMSFVLVFAEPPDTRFNFNSPRLVIYTSFPVHRSKVILPFLCFCGGLEPGEKNYLSHTFSNRKYMKNLTFGLNPSLCSTIQCPGVTICTTPFNTKKICILLSRSVFVWLLLFSK
jgi:hypothetical protein